MKCTKGINLWNEAKKIIPGGSQLLSKRAEMFLPDQWPSYYNKAKGIEIEDLDGNTFKDFSLMGVGSCILGYADEDVARAVKKAVEGGSMSTLNSPEEVELAKLLLEIHPWAGSVRFSRCGGESMAIAVRIARAHTKKDKVAFCGYHGWHDWYLSSNLADSENLDGHLLSGLDPLGVPRVLKSTSIPFEYNNIDKLKEIVKENDIGVIVVEPLRHQEPKDDFLKKVATIAKEIGAVLIFDEVSIGFRKTFGGVHMSYGVEPDIAVFAKGISNGYPMGAVIGKSDVMDAAQGSFISSTYWTERIGPAAALATIRKMKDNDVQKHLDTIGQKIGEGWQRIASEVDLDIDLIGPNCLTTFSIKHDKSLELKTLFVQEMLKRNYLAGQTVYVSYAHKESDLEDYFAAIKEVFAILKDAIDKNDIEKRLDGPVCHAGFKRLT